MQTDNDVSLVKNMFILEFSYRFSKGKKVKKQQKDIDQESEGRRRRSLLKENSFTYPIPYLWIVLKPFNKWKAFLFADSISDDKQYIDVHNQIIQTGVLF